MPIVPMKNGSPAKLKPLVWLVPGPRNTCQVWAFDLGGEEVRSGWTLVGLCQHPLQGDVALGTEDSQGRWSPAMVVPPPMAPYPLEEVCLCVSSPRGRLTRTGVSGKTQGSGPVESQQGRGSHGPQCLSKLEGQGKDANPAGKSVQRTEDLD